MTVDQPPLVSWGAGPAPEERSASRAELTAAALVVGNLVRQRDWREGLTARVMYVGRGLVVLQDPLEGYEYAVSTAPNFRGPWQVVT